MRSPEREKKAGHPYRPAFGEGVSVFAFCLLPAPSKSLLPTFLQKSTAAFGEGVSVFALCLLPAPSKSLLRTFLQKRKAAFGGGASLNTRSPCSLRHWKIENDSHFHIDIFSRVCYTVGA